MRKYLLFFSLITFLSIHNVHAESEAPFDPSGSDAPVAATMDEKQPSKEGPAQHAVAKTPRGTWLTEDGRAKVKIENCPSSNLLCGEIVWLKEPKNEKGEDKRDIHNPDPSLHNRTVIGLHILKNFRQDGDRWVDGEIYNPKNGKTYACTMFVNEEGNLDLRGHVLIELFGETQIWTPTH
ncbi:MAG: DUF2147 domain-containing protein [Candidatus Nucleicultricaceae bacterium]